MAKLDLDDLPPRVANLILGLDEGEELVLIQHGGLLRRLIVQSLASDQAAPASIPPPPARMRSPVSAVEAPAPDVPAPPISSPAVEQQTREIFETFRAAIEDEF